MDKHKPPSPEVIARIDREWPTLTKALHAIAAKHAPAQEAEDIVAQSYRGIRSGAREWDPEKDPDFAVFAGMVVISNARNWRTEAWNRRRDRGSFDEAAQRRVAGVGASPEQIAIIKQEFSIAFAKAFQKGSPEDRLFELVKRGVTEPAAQARALRISIAEVRALVGRINRVCSHVITKEREP